MKDQANKRRRPGRQAIAIIIIIIIIIIIMAPLLLFQSLTNKLVDNITQTISMQYSQELHAQMSAHIDSTLDHYFYDLDLEFNTLKLIDDLDEEELSAFIAAARQQNGISYLAFADSDGYVYEENGSYLGTMRISMLGQLLSGETRVIRDNETIGNESYIMMGTSFEEPVMMGDKSICIAILGISNDALEEKIVLHSDYSGGYTSIIHTDGSYVVKNPSEPYSGLNVFSVLERNCQCTEAELDSLRQTFENQESCILSVNGADGDSVYLYFAPVEETEWYAVNALPSTFIKSSILDLREDLETIFIAAIAILLVVAAVIVTQQVIAGRRLKKSQEELQVALQTAEEASGAKTAFLFSMSHDIRTPMNAILGYTDIGMKHVEDIERSKDSYQKIKSAGGHLLNLINDILEMSRIESGKMELDEKPVDIRKSAADITQMSEALAVSKSIDFKAEIGELQNPYIYADELHINEVLINLISNAVKYTPDGGRVRFTVSQISGASDGSVAYRFEVTDSGIGMSEEFQSHLFETFSREANTTVSKIEGTGLGLSIVKKIVDMTGGEIHVKSVQHEGSTFTVEIPFRVMDDEAIEAFRAEIQAENKLDEDIDLAGKRVLLAEDNDLNREIATYILFDAGLEIDTAEDGAFAVEAVRNRGTDYYDFILMDIQMPVMNGYEATKAIRALPGGGDIPIIALSANAFEEDKRKSIEEGMNAHVAKPIDIKVLLETVHSLTNKS